MADQKVVFTQRVQYLSGQLSQNADAWRDLFEIYQDRGYFSGGENAITDEDIASLGATAGDVAAGMTLAEQLQNFLNNLAALQSDYDQTLNKLRTDT